MTIGLGDVIRERRKELNLSQKQVADMACCNRTTVSNLERDIHSTSMDIFQSIVETLGLRIDLVEVKNDEWSDIDI